MRKSITYAPSAFFLFLSLYFTFFFFYTNVDVGWHIQVAKFIADGKLLYKDVIEVNFPIIYYSKIIPLVVSEFLNYSVVKTTEIFHYFLAISSIYLCWVVLRKSEIENNQKTLLLSAISLILLILPFAIYRNQFGQKEHYFIIFSLPYFLLSSLENFKNPNCNFSNKFKLMLGLLAGIGVCMKPYFVIPFALFEMFIFLRNCNYKSYLTRPELWGSVISGSLFLVIFLGVFYDNYLKNILPVINYTYYTHSIADYNYFLKIFLKESVIIGLIIVLFCKKSRILVPFAVLHLGAFIVTLLQNKSIDSIKYPMYSFEWILLALLAFVAFEKIKERKQLIISIILVIIICIRVFNYSNMLADNLNNENANERDKYLRFTEYLDSLNSKNLMVMAPTLGYSFPAFHNLDLEWKWKYSAYRVDPDRFYVEKENITKQDIRNIEKLEIDAITSLGNLVKQENFEYLIIQKREIFDINTIWENLETKKFEKISLYNLLIKYFPELKARYELKEIKKFNGMPYGVYSLKS